MLARVFSGTTIGLDGVLIEVEVDVATRGLPVLTIVGLPNKAIDEAKDRVKTSIVNSSFDMPDSRITVNLAPADIPKEGSSFDLPIAIGILAASGMVDKENLKNSLFVGELSLEGQVRRIPGIISIVLIAKEKRIKNIFIPDENIAEASIVDNVNIFPVKYLIDLIMHLNDQKKINKHKSINIKKDKLNIYEFDFSEIRGQEQAKRALEIAAAGFHNIHLKGPPGAGKTMLSRAFPSIFPPLSKDEILEVSKIYSVVGMLYKKSFITERPFRAPHHTVSRIGLIGGGSHPRPGEVSLAHRGVLFLDEFSEFPRSVLEALRQPLEDGLISVSRAAGSVIFPSRFVLIAASNPCPCGFLGHPKKTCRCLPGNILRYRKRLSGPILDRIDLHVEVPPVEEDKLTGEFLNESSSSIRKRIMSATERQRKRLKNSNVKTNAEMKTSDIKNLCKLENESVNLLKQAISKLSLSARSYFKVLKISQTIADLDAKEKIETAHVAEALQYRVKED